MKPGRISFQEALPTKDSQGAGGGRDSQGDRFRGIKAAEPVPLAVPGCLWLSLATPFVFPLVVSQGTCPPGHPLATPGQQDCCDHQDRQP